MKSCRANVPVSVTRQQSVVLQFTENKGNGKLEAYKPITAIVDAVTKRNHHDAPIYDVTLTFQGTITASHGVAQMLEPPPKTKHQHAEATLDNQNKSIFIIPVTCHLCGQKQIPFRALQRHTIAGSSNIFGVQQFKEALPGKEYCNYNLLRVTVCPACFFASGYADDFIRESKTVKEIPEPFDKEPILAQWNASISARKNVIASKLDGFFSENRSLEQAVLAYDLAVISSNEILKTEQKKNERVRNYAVALKSVFYRLIKAEVLMSNKKTAEAENLLIDAQQYLTEIFPYLKRDASIKAAFLMAMLGLYFETPKAVADNIQFLQQYDKTNKVRFGTEEHKTLLSSLKKISAAYQSRGEFSRKKLKGFDKPFEF